MMKYLIILTYICAFQVQAFQCPNDSTLVKYTSKFYDKVTNFCQRNIDGKLVKDGPELITNKKGKVLEKNFYSNGIKTNNTQKINEVSKTDICTEYHDLIFNKIRDIESETNQKVERTISKYDNGRCLAYPMKRLMFVTKGTPYILNFKFRSNCFIQGRLDAKFNKNLSSKLSLKNFQNFDSLELNYKWHKNIVNNLISFTLSINKGVFIDTEDNLKISFSYVQTHTVDLQKILMTHGYQGIFPKEPKFKLISVNNKTCY